MNQDPFKKETYLSQKLNEYHVNTPDFSMKPNKWDRFINFLASPTKDPLDKFVSAPNGVMLVKVVPLVAAAAITAIQLLLV